MGEITWSKAFVYALKFIAFTILWAIIGTVIVFIGLALIGLSFLARFETIPLLPKVSSTVLQIHPFIALTIGVILIVVGTIITHIGYLATFFKLMSKLIVESLKG